MIKATVKYVEPDSIAADCGINPGDVIDNINGNSIGDILDFKYLTSDDYYVVGVTKADGTYEEIEVYNEMYEQFGAEFESPLLDEARRCRNKCIFCFMDQLPPNVRSTMVFKDDDYRLSFLQGNYVTLTNITDEDIDRIVRMRISPINVSVHATDGDVRNMMLCNKNAYRIMDIMNRLAEGGIMMNAQIVLCPGVNDGDILKKSIEDLSTLMPWVHSVSVVPVGISKHRTGLYDLTPVTADKASEVIDIIEAYADKLYADYGTRVIYGADEFYIKAGRPLPPYEAYEDFPQIENGVGMMAQFAREVDLALEEEQEYTTGKKIVVTGNISKGYMESFVNKIKEKYPVDVDVMSIANDFFGDMITVTGLVCGRDIINQLKGRVEGNELVLARNMFKSDCMVFLDDTTVEDVERELNVKVTVNEVDGFDFVGCVLGRKGK